MKRVVVKVGSAVLTDNDESVNIYDGDFLKGFGVKNADEFESWLFSRREFYNDLYVSKLYELTDISIKKRDYEKAENYLKLLITKNKFE